MNKLTGAVVVLGAIAASCRRMVAELEQFKKGDRES